MNVFFFSHRNITGKALILFYGFAKLVKKSCTTLLRLIPQNLLFPVGSSPYA